MALVVGRLGREDGEQELSLQYAPRPISKISKQMAFNLRGKKKHKKAASQDEASVVGLAFFSSGWAHYRVGRGSLRSEGPHSQPRKVLVFCGIDCLTFPNPPLGSFLHTLEGPSFRASQCIYAHRVLPHVLVFSVSIARLTTENKPITVPLRADFSPESPDLDLHVGPDFQGLR